MIKYENKYVSYVIGPFIRIKMMKNASQENTLRLEKCNKWELYDTVQRLPNQGWQSTVYNVKKDGKDVLFKKIKLKKDNKESYMNEIYILKKLKKVDGVVKIYDAFFYKNKKCIGIEMEYYSHGDMLNFIENKYEKVNSKPYRRIVLNMFIQAVNILYKIHKRCIFHNDIHLGNLLYDKKNNGIVFADFGRSSNEDSDSDIYDLMDTFFILVTGYNCTIFDYDLPRIGKIKGGEYVITDEEYYETLFGHIKKLRKFEDNEMVIREIIYKIKIGGNFTLKSICSSIKRSNIDLLKES